MPRTELASARQSQLVTTYGVGSLIPVGDESFMVCSIDDWDERRAENIDEPRLARSLGVATFKAPPATGRRDVPVTRFPLMHYCSQCRKLGMPRDFGASVDKMECQDCGRELTPSRFVACCENGHIEDFPYWQWVHSRQEAKSDNHQLYLRVRGESSSLADIEISCVCGVLPVSMRGSFERKALAEVASCHGRRPWILGAENQVCDLPLRTLQRGSSNVWFSMVRSTISIPPWSGVAARFVEKHWEVVQHLDGTALRQTIERMVTAKELNADVVIDLIQRKKGILGQVEPTESDLRGEEYDALCRGNDVTSSENFVCREMPVADDVADLVVQVSEVSRLREVRALHGFSRVNPVPRAEAQQVTALSETPKNWLPAMEVLGEGVFFRLNEELVEAWATSGSAQSRARVINEAQRRHAREFQQPDPAPVSPRYVAMHSLAHVVMTELSLDAGYPVGSLRERVYAGDKQAGILVYTASSDSAGSLGGLAALADEERFANTFSNAVARASWCSADPVCSESGPSGADGLNLAACHACLLVPETSCDDRNAFLDRVSLIGHTSAPGAGLLEVLGAEFAGYTDDPPVFQVAATDHRSGGAGQDRWEVLRSLVSDSERELLHKLSTIDPDMELPSVGDEVADGIVLSLAWPGLRIAVDHPGLREQDREVLRLHGWRVVEPTASAILTSLRDD